MTDATDQTDPTAPPDPPGIDERAGELAQLEHEFSALFVQVRRMYLEHAARLSPDLSPGAYKIFTVIAGSDGIRPSALSERLLVDRSQISRMLRELESLELIERRPDPDDGRSSVIAATPVGRQRLAASRAEGSEQLRRALAEWDVDDIRTLRRLLAAMAAGERP